MNKPDPTPDPDRGCFITFEGGEGTGKSTQVQRLAARLATIGIETVMTREPGGSPKAERLREIILSGALEPLGTTAEALAFAAARVDHLDTIITPAIDEGCFVLCDRFLDSTRAYQGFVGDVDQTLISQLEKVVVANAMPDLTLILDIPAEAGLARARARDPKGKPDRFEAEDIIFHESVRQAFLNIAEAEPERCVLIDASQSEQAVGDAIWAAVKSRILEPRERARESGKKRPRRGRPAKLRVIEGSGGSDGSSNDRESGKPDKSGSVSDKPAGGDPK